MIIDLTRFIREEKPFWTELESLLDRMDRDAAFRMDVKTLKRFHYLYQRASSALSRMVNLSSEKHLKVYLETLVGRAFAEIHETRRRSSRFSLFSWFFKAFPNTVRKHGAALMVSLAITLSGCAFGAFAVSMDTSAKESLLPFAHLMGDPGERVAWEESGKNDRLSGQKSTFSSQLIANNTRVSIFAMGLGITWGIGTFLLLFSNGVILGAVAADYIMAGKSAFLAGWLLPHGSVEIPCIILAGQAGFVLAGALTDKSRAVSMKTRLRNIGGDIVILMGGVALLLVWAGFVEAFLSQYHEPVIPYPVKIGFGCVELALLGLFLALGGKEKRREPHEP
jgi:uncharacterized membrane protein SpoIIM required for sporulation